MISKIFEGLELGLRDMKRQPKDSRCLGDSSKTKGKNQDRWIEQLTRQEMKLTEGKEERIKIM